MTARTGIRCASSRMRMTTRDGLISAAVLIATTLAMSTLGIWANRSGHHDVGEFLKGLAFPVSMMVSMPFGIMKGQPWRAQAFVLGVTLTLLLVIGIVSVKL